MNIKKTVWVIVNERCKIFTDIESRLHSFTNKRDALDMLNYYKKSHQECGYSSHAEVIKKYKVKKAYLEVFLDS